MFLEEKRRKKMLSIYDGTLEKKLNVYKILLLKSKTSTAKLKHPNEVEDDPKQHAGMKKKIFFKYFLFFCAINSKMLHVTC